jgi:hypothetical protein
MHDSEIEKIVAEEYRVNAKKPSQETILVQEEPVESRDCECARKLESPPYDNWLVRRWAKGRNIFQNLF